MRFVICYPCVNNLILSHLYRQRSPRQQIASNVRFLSISNTGASLQDDSGLIALFNHR